MDDHAVLREGLRGLLEKLPGVEVIGEAGDGRSAAQLARRLSPDVVVMDITMPSLNGIEATRQITSKSPETKVIALSMHSSRQYAVEMLKAGASAYVLKRCAFDELSRAVDAVVAGGKYLSSEILGTVVEDYARGPLLSDFSVSSVLTEREREILQLLAEGRSTKQVALHLHVSVKTVETHRSRIMEKLGLYSVAELTKYALREGLVSLDT